MTTCAEFWDEPARCAGDLEDMIKRYEGAPSWVAAPSMAIEMARMSKPFGPMINISGMKLYTRTSITEPFTLVTQGKSPMPQLTLEQLLQQIASIDIQTLVKKDAEYGSSWKELGGISAFVNLHRKWSRLHNQVDAKRASDVNRYDIFGAIEQNNPADGESVLESLRDLRRYCFLVESEIMVRQSVDKHYGEPGGTVQVPADQVEIVGNRAYHKVLNPEIRQFEQPTVTSPVEDGTLDQEGRRVDNSSDPRAFSIDDLYEKEQIALQQPNTEMILVPENQSLPGLGSLVNCGKGQGIVVYVNQDRWRVVARRLPPPTKGTPNAIPPSPQERQRQTVSPNRPSPAPASLGGSSPNPG